MAAALAVVSVALVTWLVAVDDPGGVRVDTGSTTASTTTQPERPSLDGLEYAPIGEVSVLSRGVMGGADWWLLDYEADLGGPAEQWRCTVLTDERGVPYPGANGCGGSSEGARTSGSGFGDAHVGTQDLLFSEASREVDEIHAVLVSGETISAVFHPIPGTDRDVWMLPLPSHGGATNHSFRARSLLERVYLVQDGREETIYPDPSGILVPRTGNPDAEHVAFCTAVDAFNSSGASVRGGIVSRDAIPFLQAIVDASPPDIVASTQAALEATEAGRPVGAAGTAAIDYWNAHC